MDNLGVFDRSRPLPTGGELQQADGTAWMGFYCTSMLRIALELARHHNRAYEDVASKFLEHFVFISDSLNNLGGRGLWDERGRLLLRPAPGRRDSRRRCKLRALIGLIPLLAVQVLDEEDIRAALPEFRKRTEWFLENRKDLLQACRRRRDPRRGAAPLPAPRPPRPRPAGAGPALPAGRERVPVAVRRPVPVAGLQGPPVRVPRGRRRP